MNSESRITFNTKLLKSSDRQITRIPVFTHTPFQPNLHRIAHFSRFLYISSFSNRFIYILYISNGQNAIRSCCRSSNWEGIVDLIWFIHSLVKETWINFVGRSCCVMFQSKGNFGKRRECSGDSYSHYCISILIFWRVDLWRYSRSVLRRPGTLCSRWRLSWYKLSIFGRLRWSRLLQCWDVSPSSRSEGSISWSCLSSPWKSWESSNHASV